MKKILVLAAALGAAVLPLSAMANRPGSWFIRAEAGDTKHDIEVDGAKDDDNDTSFSLRGGYYYTPNFGFEFFYSDFGGYEQEATAEYDDGSVEIGKLSLDTAAIGAGIFGKKNFGQDDLGFYVGGRAGVLHAKTDLKAVGGLDTDDSWNAAYAGIGIGYDFNPNFGLGLSYDYTQGKPEFYGVETKVKVQTLSLGLEYRF